MEEELVARVNIGKRSHNDDNQNASTAKRVYVRGAKKSLSKIGKVKKEVVYDFKITDTTLDRLQDDLIKPILNYGLAYHDTANLWCLGNRRLQSCIRRLVEFVYLTPCIHCNPQCYRSKEPRGTSLTYIYRTFENEGSKVPLLNSQQSKINAKSSVIREVSVADLNKRLQSCKCQAISPKIIPCVKTIIASPALTLQEGKGGDHDFNFVKFTQLDLLEFNNVYMYTSHNWRAHITTRRMFVKPAHLPSSIREVLFAQPVDFSLSTSRNDLPNLRVLRSSNEIYAGTYLPPSVTKVECNLFRSGDTELKNILELKICEGRNFYSHISRLPSLQKLYCHYSHLIVSDMSTTKEKQAFLPNLDTLKLIFDDEFPSSRDILIPRNTRLLKLVFNTKWTVGLDVHKYIEVLSKQLTRCSKLECIQVIHPIYQPDKITGLIYAPDEAVFDSIATCLYDSLRTTNHCSIENW